jgi:hypothetical protein
MILFPISFQINLSSVLWRDPRARLRFLKELRISQGETAMLSLANIALSNNLTEDLMRFLNSGYQTVCEPENQMVSIRNGKHPIVLGGSKVNIFSYSIGAFLTEIVIMGNPQKLFIDLKFLNFCRKSYSVSCMEIRI